MPDAGLFIRALTVRYSKRLRPAVSNVDLTIAPGRTLALVGPSGAGKSTLLRAICGLCSVEAGEIVLNERRIDALAPQHRRTAMVFAADALVRTMSVRRNLQLASSGPHARERAEEFASALSVSEHLERRPGVLSTGERQRISIARAVLSNPEALMLDEPLAPLDPDLRIRVREEIVHVRERFGGPIIIVTHDHADALAVADELAVLMEGAIEDIGEPQRVYERPATLRAARFLGARPMNVIDGAHVGADGTLAAFRPERAVLGSGALRGMVVRVERTGADMYVHVDVAGTIVLVRTAPDETPQVGTLVSIDVPQRYRCLYDPRTGTLIA